MLRRVVHFITTCVARYGSIRAPTPTGEQRQGKQAGTRYAPNAARKDHGDHGDTNDRGQAVVQTFGSQSPVILDDAISPGAPVFQVFALLAVCFRIGAIRLYEEHLQRIAGRRR